MEPPIYQVKTQIKCCVLKLVNELQPPEELQSVVPVVRKKSKTLPKVLTPDHDTTDSSSDEEFLFVAREIVSAPSDIDSDDAAGSEAEESVDDSTVPPTDVSDVDEGSVHSGVDADSSDTVSNVGSVHDHTNDTITQEDNTITYEEDETIAYEEDDSDSSSEDERSPSVRRSARHRAAPSRFTLDSLGGDPSYVRY